MNDFSGQLAGKPKLPFLWTDVKFDFIPRLPSRYNIGHRRQRSKSRTFPHGAEDLTSLKTSFNLWDGIRDFQHHKWRTSDLQYIFLIGLSLFSLSISPPAPGLKFFSVLAAIWLMLMPATRQFFLPSLAIWVWLLYFFSSRYVFGSPGYRHVIPLLTLS